MKLATHTNPLLRHWRLPGGTPAPNLWYRCCRQVCRAGFGLVWKVTTYNRHLEPATGSAVYVSNHQSFLDPMLVGVGLARPMNYMARDTLFRGRVFEALIRSLGAFPVRRATADTGALKEALRRLKRGEQLVVFPEGTRTRDGRVGPFLPGMVLLARRGAEWTVPVMIDGAFECWPRARPLPRVGRVVVAYGRPLHRDEVRNMDDREVLARVRGSIIELQAEVRRRLGRPALAYDK